MRRPVCILSKGLVAGCHSFCLFWLFITYIHSFIQSQYIHPSPFAEASLHIFIACVLSGENFPVGPSRESNSGLPYSNVCILSFWKKSDHCPFKNRALPTLAVEGTHFRCTVLIAQFGGILKTLMIFKGFSQRNVGVESALKSEKITSFAVMKGLKSSSDCVAKIPYNLRILLFTVYLNIFWQVRRTIVQKTTYWITLLDYTVYSTFKTAAAGH